MKRWLQGSLIALCLLLTLPCCAAKRRSHYQKDSGKPAIQQVSASGVKWESYIDAVQQSGKDKKPIGLFFTGSDWCIWCIKMQDQILNTSEFQNYANDNLHMVELDFPQSNNQPADIKEQNQALKSRYGVNGFPTLVFIDANGTEKARMGFEYGGGENYVKKIQAALHRK
ncbi:Disulfide bond reductase DsbH precursor,thiol:disulfide interchange protein precursor,Thioredoxin-related protein [Chlamydia poikilotherma]|uniref:Disulfide bond reductase DsbH,thiol:disulfide interchange protein,Thioredoxin-related protein n=1 Tax=Chlamydia poikilotherma TaxID=1967783 RepID=A0A3B0PTU6_9CHLA|nr:disulfide reductase DsbH [Chlamydia poikilotherma]SYX09301.1 Disulfide bond reductase DsbH precursor,thiol:disulfide interchange protein precursor,Thioredoxin-related protein [Chlamydia poikilotherma]